MEQFIYTLLSWSVALLAVAAIFVGRRAMKHGLTYASFRSVVYTLTVIAIARVWHSLRESLGLEEIWGGWPEMAEYAMYLVAYAPFIRLNSMVNALGGKYSDMEERKNGRGNAKA